MQRGLESQPVGGTGHPGKATQFPVAVAARDLPAPIRLSAGAPGALGSVPAGRQTGGMSSTAELPRVSGRHRNRALAKARAVRAVELAAAGMTYAGIADVLGYADRGTVHRIVRKELEARSADSVDLLRAVEVARLDALQRGLWTGHRRGSGVVRRRGSDHRPAGAPAGGRGCVPGPGRGDRAAGGPRPEDRRPGAALSP